MNNLFDRNLCFPAGSLPDSREAWRFSFANSCALMQRYLMGGWILKPFIYFVEPIVHKYVNIIRNMLCSPVLLLMLVFADNVGCYIFSSKEEGITNTKKYFPLIKNITYFILHIMQKDIPYHGLQVICTSSFTITAYSEGNNEFSEQLVK